MDHPIGELFEKVNDGRYHVVKFTRDGANSTIQVDSLVAMTKFPTGNKNTVIFTHVLNHNECKG